MTDRVQQFEDIVAAQGAAEAYSFLTGRDDWAEKMIQMVPPHMHAGWARWAAYGWQANPGGFLSAVVSNDLFGAFSKADASNAAHIEATCRWLYNYSPAGMRDADNWKGLLEAELVARSERT